MPLQLRDRAQGRQGALRWVGDERPLVVRVCEVGLRILYETAH